MTTKQKIERFSRTVKKLFPGLDISHLRYGNNKNGKDIWNYYHFNIPSSNSNLENSPYYYDKKSFVHFTSIPALASILREKSIRLYNLHTLNDPREFTFASKFFKLNKELIIDAKDNLFFMSFCESEILKKSSIEFNMWRLYGQQGKGAAITFSLVNNPIYWDDFHLSKVVYGSDNRNHFKKLSLLLEKLNSDKPTIEVDFGKLYAFHKSKLFEPELEVRLLFDRREKRAGMSGKTVTFKDKLIFPIIKSDLFKLIDNNDKVRYLQSPIFYEGLTSVESGTPLLKIDNINIGYVFGEESKKIIEKIQELCKENLGYIPEIKQTRLRKFYWDIESSSNVKSENVNEK